MSMSFFVAPKVDRLTVPTPYGEMWIDVKHRLNAGEVEELFERWHDEGGVFKASRMRRGKIMAFGVAWSLEQPISDDAIKALDMVVFKALATAVEEHETKSEEEATVRKNDQDGAIEPSPISPSENS